MAYTRIRKRPSFILMRSLFALAEIFPEFQHSLRSLLRLRLCLETCGFSQRAERSARKMRQQGAKRVGAPKVRYPNELANCGRSHARVPRLQPEWNSPLRSVMRIASGLLEERWYYLHSPSKNNGMIICACWHRE